MVQFSSMRGVDTVHFPFAGETVTCALRGGRGGQGGRDGEKAPKPLLGTFTNEGQ
jgi:hypothetical protein